MSKDFWSNWSTYSDDPSVKYLVAETTTNSVFKESETAYYGPYTELEAKEVKTHLEFLKNEAQKTVDLDPALTVTYEIVITSRSISWDYQAEMWGLIDY